MKKLVIWTLGYFPIQKMIRIDPQIFTCLVVQNHFTKAIYCT